MQSESDAPAEWVECQAEEERPGFQSLHCWLSNTKIPEEQSWDPMLPSPSSEFDLLGLYWHLWLDIIIMNPDCSLKIRPFFLSSQHALHTCVVACSFGRSKSPLSTEFTSAKGWLNALRAGKLVMRTSLRCHQLVAIASLLDVCCGSLRIPGSQSPHKMCLHVHSCSAGFYWQGSKSKFKHFQGYTWILGALKFYSLDLPSSGFAIVKLSGRNTYILQRIRKKKIIWQMEHLYCLILLWWWWFW